MYRDLNDGPAILFCSLQPRCRYRDLERRQFPCLGDAIAYAVEQFQDLSAAAWIETPNGEVVSKEIGPMYLAAFSEWKKTKADFGDVVGK